MAFTTSALGLTIWNSASDKYNYQQLADNWLLVEGHDHTPGKGKLIQTDSIAPGAITSDKIASGVINSNIRAKSVSTDSLIDYSVTIDKIAPESVNYSRLHRHSRMPLGTVVPWFHPNPTEETLVNLFGVQDGGTTIPSWVICDGRTVEAGHHDFGQGTFSVPNLQNTFVMGATGIASDTSVNVSGTFKVASASTTSRNFTITTANGGILATTTPAGITTYGMSFNTTSVFGSGTTFYATGMTTETVSSVTTKTYTCVASNLASLNVDVTTPITITNISTNPNRVGAVGGQNAVSLEHSHTYSHQHTVPAHGHVKVNLQTEDTEHTHSTTAPFVHAATTGGSASNFKTGGPKHLYNAKYVTVGPVRGGKTVWQVVKNSTFAVGDGNLNGDVAGMMTGFSSGSTSTELFSMDNRPSYTALMYIIKVKN